MVAELLTEISRITCKEPPCKRIEVYQSEADEARFLLCEHWDSKEGWQGHREEKVFIDLYQAQVLPLVEREAHVCTLLS